MTSPQPLGHLAPINCDDPRPRQDAHGKPLPFRLPPQYEPYRHQVNTYGGGAIEDVVNGPAGAPGSIVQLNRERVRAQLALISRLHSYGFLKSVATPGIQTHTGG